MASVQLVNLMRIPVRIYYRKNDPDSVLIFPPSGKELTIVRYPKVVGSAGDGGHINIVHMTPLKAIGIPEVVDFGIRYIVTTVAFESIPDRKDFVTPNNPFRDSKGQVIGYRNLRGHSKEEVLRFFKEAQASRSLA
jgi:hypothetical protein